MSALYRTGTARSSVRLTQPRTNYGSGGSVSTEHGLATLCSIFSTITTGTVLERYGGKQYGTECYILGCAMVQSMVRLPVTDLYTWIWTYRQPGPALSEQLREAVNAGGLGGKERIRVNDKTEEEGEDHVAELKWSLPICPK